MLLVSFHGGSSGINTVAAYDDDGKNPYIDALSGTTRLSELRGIAFGPGSVLWVTSGSKDESGISCFDTSSFPYAYIGSVAQYQDISSLWHPFDLTFDGEGNCFVSNQDTNVVAKLTAGSDYRSATPAPVSSGLPAGGTYLEGTFVGSSKGDLPGVGPTTPVPGDAGLGVSISGGKVTHSVRGVLWSNGLLYVADEVSNHVKVYDPTGAYVGKSNPVQGPVHLLLSGDTLYTGSGDEVLYANLGVQPSAPQFSPVPRLSIDSVSGMCFDDVGNFYAASRTKNKLWKCLGFSPTAGPTSATSWAVPDSPEFMFYATDPSLSGNG